MSDQYQAFLAAKQKADIPSGHDAEPPEWLFPFQRAIVRWALKRGRAAIFADTGLGKTAMQVAWADEVARHTGKPALIVAPLSVAHQTVREAAQWGVAVEYQRHPADTDAAIRITNYEMLAHFDMADYVAVVLDESSILKAHDGKTRTAIIESCRNVPYRLSCTATPGPNDHMELGNQAEFLGTMSRDEMLAMFFTHDGGNTSKWRLKGHGRTRFWEWMATWAVVVRKPSDLGFEDAGYDLPPMTIHEHIVDVPMETEGELFGRPAMTLTEQRQAKRQSLDHRVAGAAELVAREPAEPWLVWCHLNDESDALRDAIDDAEAVAGADPPAAKELAMDAFTDGALRVLVSKPSICGFGMNWQHCARVAFAGLDHSFESFYQAIRRCWRFGQTRPVEVHVFISEAERMVLDSIRAKEQQHDEMSRQMVKHMRGAMRREVFGATSERSEYMRDTATGDGWTLHLGDCVEVVSEMAEGSVDYTIFSPPFASLYTYSNSDRDMGNCKDDGEFAEHFGHLIPELFRASKSGRLASVHCMNLPTTKQHHGWIGIRDFRGEIIKAFEAAGWIYHSEVVIWKDPVTAMQRTKALGLLHKQIKKDSAMSRQGIPDYLVTFRKPGENPSPVTHTNESFPVDRWQRYASPVWMDINPTRTLQFRDARDSDDERHICPLQLDVIERAIDLWTNPGDLVLSPFAGIGSEGHGAVTLGRRFVGVELKRSYWDLATRNLKHSASTAEMDLFKAAAG